MARLPSPGGDSGNWGSILNDFLSQAHNSDGTLKNGIVTPAITDGGFERTANKAQANGYASLDGTGKVPSAQLPAGTIYEPAVLQYSFQNLVSTGASSVINFSAILTGYLTPPLPTWLSISGSNLVFGQAGVYMMQLTFSQFAPTTATTSKMYKTSSSPQNLDLGGYAAQKPNAMIPIYVADDGMPDFASAVGQGAAYPPVFIATTGASLGLSGSVTFSGGGTTGYYLGYAVINKLQ